MNRVGSNDFLGPGGERSFRPGGRPGPARGADRPGPPERMPSGRQQGPPAPPAARGREEPAREEQAEKAEPRKAEEADEDEGSAGSAGGEGGAHAEEQQSKAKGLLAEMYVTKDVKEGLTSVRELSEGGADMGLLFQVMLTHSLETKGTDWDVLHALLAACVEEQLVQSADLERGARQLLDQLDDLAVDVPKAPLQVGAVLGGLVAGGGADLKVLAQHIRTADANPDEIEEGEDTMLVGGGGAAKTLGALLQKLAEAKGEEAAKAAWDASGESLAAFLPQGDREDAGEAQKVVERFGLAAVLG